MHIRFKISAFINKFPFFIRKKINSILNKKWPVWGYHTNSKSQFKSMEKFLTKKEIKWEHSEVNGYNHIYIYDIKAAKQFAKKFGYSFYGKE